MRQIKASEVKPGMTIRWDQGGITYECTVSSVGPARFGVNVMAERSAAHIYDETPVTVLAEPQPEEPTWFGARVVVDGQRFLRSPEEKSDDQPWLEENTGVWHNWDDLCEMGNVQIIPDQGWTVPTDTETAPVVPDRIEEWPEDDTALRKHEWRDRLGRIWYHGFAGFDTGWSGGGALIWGKPSDGPWIRVVDA
ncbi:hypothetical protein GKZ75_08420 [Kocuria indica]|uniref:Uncharacterized protein n=1 Tax=Kocuria marina subsp. indica TaxID=1049583 RepID=A0A6N9QYC9_9MICC|nr:hypothetical protein [Kocuria indica]NDO78246.1 hypothetical protein [Kocuria indica]